MENHRWLFIHKVLITVFHAQLCDTSIKLFSLWLLKNASFSVGGILCCVRWPLTFSSDRPNKRSPRFFSVIFLLRFQFFVVAVNSKARTKGRKMQAKVVAFCRLFSISQRAHMCNKAETVGRRGTGAKTQSKLNMNALSPNA